MQLGFGLTLGSQGDGTPPDPSVPVISSVTIDGTPTVGVPVGVIVSRTGYPTPTYTYVWKLDGTPIGGATGATYTPVEGDVGGDLSCTVTATNSEGSDEADSDAVEVVAAPIEAVGAESGGEIGTPDVVAILVASGVEIGSEVGTPDLFVTDLFAAGVESASQVGSPVVTEVGVMVPQGVESATEIGSATVSASGTLDAVLLGGTMVEAGTPGEIHVSYVNEVANGKIVRSFFGGTNILGALNNDPYESTGIAAPGSSETVDPDTGYTSTGGDWSGQGVGWIYVCDPDNTIISAARMTPFDFLPDLRNQTGAANGPTEITGSVTTRAPDGTLYVYASTSATPPSPANMADGTGAVYHGSVPVTSFGTVNFTATGLTAGTGYYIHLMQAEDTSDIVTTDQITTAGAATVPAAFTASDWSLTEAFSAGADKLNININVLPSDGGSAITALEYRVDSGSGYGAEQTLSGTGTGTRQITVLASTEADVQVRAVNSVGDGDWSDVQTATPQLSGGTTATSVTIDGRTFTFGGSYQIVRHIDGPVAIVSASTVSVIPPAATSGLDGTMKNPLYSAASGSQGFDNRRSNYSAGLNLNGGAISLDVGDIMVASKSVVATVYNRAGQTESYQAIYVTATAPDADSLAPPMIGWSGRSGIDLESGVDWAAKANDITRWTITPTERFSYAEMIAKLGFNPGAAHYPYTSNQGYEWAHPNLWGGPYLGVNENYGYSTVRRMNQAFVALQDNYYSQTERADILKSICSYGKQTYHTWEGAGRNCSADGGHYQIQYISIALYLWATGQTGLIDSDLFDAYAGNWNGAFLLDAGHISRAVPFGSATAASLKTDIGTYPDHWWHFHRRPILAISGDQITFAVGRTSGGGDAEKANFSSLMMTNGTDSFRCSGNEGDISLTDTQKTITVTGHNFTVGQTIWFEPGWTLTEGEPFWHLKKLSQLPQAVMATPDAAYVDLQGWTAGILLLHAIGRAQAEHAAAIAWVSWVNAANTPSAPFDFGVWYDATRHDGALWAEHGAEILALPQGDASPPTSIDSITQISETSVDSGDYPGLSDGIVIGRLNGETSKSVYMAGTATGGDAGAVIQVRLLDQADSVFMDWTDAATLDGAGNWSGTVSVPLCTDGWVKTRLRAKTATGVTLNDDTKWGVGDRIWIEGQSQLTIWASLTNASVPYDSGMSGLGSYVNYTGGAPDMLATGDKISDGIAGFINQWYFGRSDTTPVQVVLEAKSGSGIVTLCDDDESTVGSSARAWAPVTTKVAEHGSTVTAMVVNHGTFDAGTGLTGAASLNILLGTATGSQAGYNIVHDFNDVFDTGWELVVSPITRHGINDGTDSHSREQIDRANELDLYVGPPTPDYWLQDGGVPHPEPSEYGSRNTGNRVAEAARRALGYSSTINPHFTGTATRSADGTQITIPVTINSGGTLAATDLDPTYAGFTVSENGGSSYSGSGFTISISGGNVVLTKGGGWAAAGSLIVKHKANYYNYASSGAVDDATETQVMDAILYDGAPDDALGLGWPVSGLVSAGKWYIPSTEIIVPTVTQASGDVTATGVESAGEVGAPAVFTTELTAVGVESASQVGAASAGGADVWEFSGDQVINIPADEGWGFTGDRVDTIPDAA